jgi:hypothetical protein
LTEVRTLFWTYPASALPQTPRTSAEDTARSEALMSCWPVLHEETKPRYDPPWRCDLVTSELESSRGRQCSGLQHGLHAHLATHGCMDDPIEPGALQPLARFLQRLEKVACTTATPSSHRCSQVSSLVPWRLQFLDDAHLLIKLATPEVLLGPGESHTNFPEVHLSEMWMLMTYMGHRVSTLP